MASRNLLPVFAVPRGITYLLHGAALHGGPAPSRKPTQALNSFVNIYPTPFTNSSASRTPCAITSNVWSMRMSSYASAGTIGAFYILTCTTPRSQGSRHRVDSHASIADDT